MKRNSNENDKMKSNEMREIGRERERERERELILWCGACCPWVEGGPHCRVHWDPPGRCKWEYTFCRLKAPREGYYINSTSNCSKNIQ